jgi:hypothetical protein
VFAVGGYRGESVRALSAKVPSKLESGIKILLVAKWLNCPTGLLLKCAEQTSFKQFIQGTRLNLILLRKMSVVGSEDIKDGDCECERVTRRPPISYAQFKYPKWLTKPDSVKVRLPKGNQYMCDLMNDTILLMVCQHTTQLLLKHALSTDFDIGIRIYAQLCRQASVSNAPPFSRSVSPMVHQDASPHSHDCGEDSFMARIGCRVSLLHGGARGSGV